MSDVVAVAWPAVVNWLYDHGRLAVQFFLVCAGFLTAGSLARYASLDLSEALKLVWQRYLRLAIPLMAALSFTVLVTEWVRSDFEHASLSAPPDWGQALAHIVFLQHVLDLEALSAGIWYVAIDLQLYVMALLSLTVVVGTAATVDFGREVRPILSDKCSHCHGPDERGRKGKLRFDTREGALREKNG